MNSNNEDVDKHCHFITAVEIDKPGSFVFQRPLLYQAVANSRSIQQFSTTKASYNPFASIMGPDL